MLMDNLNIGGLGTWGLVIIFILFFLNWGNGFGGFGNNAAAWLLNWQNNNNNTDNIENLINNNTSWQQQLANQSALQNQTNLISTWFCGVNQNIERAIQQANQNTCAIMQNCTANTQKILDMMCTNTITQLRTDLAEAKLEANNAQQTNDLLAKLAPYPTPSRIVSSPYTSIYPPTTTTASS